MSRDAILGSIRAALDLHEGETARRRAVRDRLAAKAEAPSLARTRLPPAELVTLFKTHLAALGADLIDVAAPEAVPAAIADYLRSRRRPLRVRMGGDPLF